MTTENCSIQNCGPFAPSLSHLTDIRKLSVNCSFVGHFHSEYEIISLISLLLNCVLDNENILPANEDS